MVCQHQLHFDPSLALQVVLREREISSVKVVPPQGPGHFGGAIRPPRKEVKAHPLAKPGRAGERSGTSSCTSPSSTCLVPFPRFRFLCTPVALLRPPSSPPLRPSPWSYNSGKVACMRCARSSTRVLIGCICHSVLHAPYACSMHEITSEPCVSPIRWPE